MKDLQTNVICAKEIHFFQKVCTLSMYGGITRRGQGEAEPPLVGGVGSEAPQRMLNSAVIAPKTIHQYSCNDPKIHRSVRSTKIYIRATMIHTRSTKIHLRYTANTPQIHSDTPTDTCQMHTKYTPDTQ